MRQRRINLQPMMHRRGKNGRLNLCLTQIQTQVERFKLTSRPFPPSKTLLCISSSLPPKKMFFYYKILLNNNVYVGLL